MARPDKIVRYAIAGAVAAYSFVLWRAGLQLDDPWKKLVTFLPLVGVALLLLWDKWLWRLPGLHQATKRPRLEGLWQAELRPTAESNIGPGGNRGPIPAYLVIRQSYWSIAIRLYTAESRSDSRAHFWHSDTSSEVEALSFLYENVPAQEHQHRSPAHLGSCSLDCMSRTPKEIDGVYFTDRYTKGDMRLTFVDRSTGHASFDAAHRHAGSQP